MDLVKVKNMKKVIIIGCPGSGKSTFARKLSQKTGLPLFYLDMIYHKPDKTTVTKEEFDAKLSSILQKDAWIIDGNYMRTIPIRVRACDTVIWLDYKAEVCLQGIHERRGKPREDMPWVESEPDEEFLRFVENFTSESKPLIQDVLEQYKDKNIIVFHTREESEHFLLT